LADGGWGVVDGEMALLIVVLDHQFFFGGVDTDDGTGGVHCHDEPSQLG
jgi:hypothetical protein